MIKYIMVQNIDVQLLTVIVQDPHAAMAAAAASQVVYCTRVHVLICFEPRVSLREAGFFE